MALPPAVTPTAAREQGSSMRIWHFDNLLGDVDIARREGVDQQLFLHQRHTNVEHRSRMICSTVCRWTLSWCLTPARRSGRDPAASTSSTSREKYSVPAAWGVGCSGAWPCGTARSHLPALAIVCLCSVELNGPYTRQWPCGRSPVRVCTTNAAAALCVAEQHHPQVVASWD